MEVDTLKSQKIYFFVSVYECYKCFTLTLGKVTCTVTCYSCVPGHLPWMLMFFWIELGLAVVRLDRM